MWMSFIWVLNYDGVNPKQKGHPNGCPFCGARGGSRTRTPLRALAPEASESTNSTTRAWSGMHCLLSAWDMLPHPPSCVNTFLSLPTDFFLSLLPSHKAPDFPLSFSFPIYFILFSTESALFLLSSQRAVKKSFPENSCLFKFHIDFPAHPGYNTLKYFN